MGAWSWLTNLWGPIDDVPAASASSVPMTEAGLPLLLTGSDPDATLTLAQGGGPTFRRLSQSERDLPSFTLDRGREIAWALYEANPLGKRIIELVRDYILGEDVRLVVEPETSDEAAKADQAQRQEIIDAFWDDPANNLGMRIDEYVLDLGLFGELCLRVAVNPANGQVLTAYIDPSNIQDVLVDPGTLLPAEIVLKAATGAATERLRVVRVDRDPTSLTYGRWGGVRTDAAGRVLDTYRESPDGAEKPYLGACFFWAINKPVSARRGRSDLLPVAEYIDGVDQILFGEVDRQLLMKAFIWDVTLTGMDATQIAEWLKLNGTAPPPGSLRAHNEKAVWAAVSPDLQSYDTAKAVDVLLGYIAAGAGIPKTWLSSTDDVNRATASELGEPAFKRLTRRQKFVKDILVKLGTFALDQAELAGVLGTPRVAKAGQLPAPWPLTAQMPELRPKDLAAGTSAMQQGAAALTTMMADGLIDQQVGQDASVMMLGATLGLEVDIDAMRERIEEEEAEREQEQQDMLRALGTTDESGPPASRNGNGRLPAAMRGGPR